LLVLHFYFAEFVPAKYSELNDEVIEISDLLAEQAQKQTGLFYLSRVLAR